MPSFPSRPTEYDLDWYDEREAYDQAIETAVLDALIARDALWLNVFWDDFERPDTTGGTSVSNTGLGTAPDGRKWSATGTGYLTAKIADGGYIVDGNTYAFHQLPFTPRIMRGTVRFPAGTLDTQTMTMITGTTNELFRYAVHNYVTRTSMGLQIRDDNVTTGLGLFTIDLTDGEEHEVEFEVDGDTVIGRLDGVEVGRGTDPRVSDLNGPWATWQIRITAGETSPRWERVAALARSGAKEQADIAALQTVANRLDPGASAPTDDVYELRSFEGVRSWKKKTYLDQIDFYTAADGTDYAPSVNRMLAKAAATRGSRAEIALLNRPEAYRTQMTIPAHGNITLRGHGSLTELIQDASVHLFRSTGVHGAETALTADVALGATTVTLPTGEGGAFERGDYIGLRSTAIVYSTNGQARDIRKVVHVSGDVLTLDMPTIHTYAVAAGAVFWKVTPVPGLTIGDFSVSNPNPQTNFGYILLAQVLNDFAIENIVGIDAGGGVLVYDAINGTIENISYEMLRNGTTLNPSLGAYGYGVTLGGACSLVTVDRLRSVGDIRHLFTTVSWTPDASTFQGGPHDYTVSHSVGSGSPNGFAVFDTHEFGEAGTFHDVHALGATQTGAPGIQLRAKKHRVVNSTSRRNSRGITVVSTATDTTIEGGDYSDNLLYGVGMSADYTTLRGADVNDNGQDGVVLGAGRWGLLVQACEIRNNLETGIVDQGALEALLKGNLIPFGGDQTLGVSNFGIAGGANCRAYENDVTGYAGANGFRDAVAAAVIKRNAGYRTENGGAASVVNGGTIAHGMQRTPTRVVVTASAANRRVAVTAITSTTFTISLTDGAGATIGSAETVYWQAEA